MDPRLEDLVEDVERLILVVIHVIRVRIVLESVKIFRFANGVVSEIRFVGDVLFSESERVLAPTHLVIDRAQKLLP